MVLQYAKLRFGTWLLETRESNRSNVDFMITRVSKYFKGCRRICSWERGGLPPVTFQKAPRGPSISSDEWECGWMRLNQPKLVRQLGYRSTIVRQTQGWLAEYRLYCCTIVMISTPTPTGDTSIFRSSPISDVHRWGDDDQLKLISAWKAGFRERRQMMASLFFLVAVAHSAADKSSMDFFAPRKSVVERMF